MSATPLTIHAPPAADEVARTKLGRMAESLRERGSVLVAFSGGADSTFVLKAALDTLGRSAVLAVTGRSDSLAAGEFEEACRLAVALDAEHLVVDTREFDNPDYVANPTNRCFHCKDELYGRLRSIAAERGLAAVINGVNADDLGDYRPGLKAAAQHGVLAPAADAGLTKDEIRALSRAWGLETSDKPASPCLSSRVQYGEAITPEKLRMIEAAEVLLHELGFPECRVRHHDKLARIEVPAARIGELAEPSLRSRVESALRGLGYFYVTLDMRGLRSGSMNEVIAFGRKQPPLE